MRPWFSHKALMCFHSFAAEDEAKYTLETACIHRVTWKIAVQGIGYPTSPTEIEKQDTSYICYMKQSLLPPKHDTSMQIPLPCHERIYLPSILSLTD